MASAAPILVTGSHRSGTTWVGRMLGMSGEIGYVHEPFSNECPGWSGGGIPRQFQYICPENEAPFRPVLDRVMGFRYPILAQLPRLRRLRQAGRLGLDAMQALTDWTRGARVLMKDPLAVFSAPWLAQTYGMQVVLMVRNPAAFASSLKRLQWSFDFRQWAEQPLLLRDLLPSRCDAIRSAAAQPPDIIDQAILLWNGIYDAARQFQARYPAWHIVNYEELAAAPLAGFERLYRALALRWDARVAARVAAYSDAGNVKEVAARDPGTIKRDSLAASRTWQQRLTTEEIARVRAGVRDVAASFYADEAWASVARPRVEAVAA